MSEYKQVEELLLTPIVCEKSYSKIKKVEGVIQTPQLYYGTADEDMSDFSIGFYEIVYRGILPYRKLLNDRGRLNSKEFAGDTMNSFHSIANIVLGDCSSKQRSPLCKWPEYLKEYHRRYHCLANFWVIPMRHGRTGTKLNKYDSADLYISKIRSGAQLREKTEICYGDDCFKNYFTCFDLKDFSKIHFLGASEEENGLSEFYKRKDKSDGKRIISRAMDMMKRRAKAISEHPEICRLLLDYFEKLDLID